jgi:hypothetical protein
MHTDGYPGTAKQLNPLGHTPAFASPALQPVCVHMMV